MSGVMKRNTAGDMVSGWWAEVPSKFPAVHLHDSVVMPNHFHALISISNFEESRNVRGNLKGRMRRPNELPCLSEIVQWFKTMTTNEYFRGVKMGEWAAVPGRLWQRNYFEHIVRSPRAFDQVCTYIRENPKNWDSDAENTDYHGEVPDEIFSIIRADSDELLP